MKLTESMISPNKPFTERHFDSYWRGGISALTRWVKARISSTPSAICSV
jgi:hypothetical protein